MKIIKVGFLLAIIMARPMVAMDNPNPEGGPNYPYQYHYSQYPYNVPPIDYSQQQSYGYYPYHGQPAPTGYTDPYYGHYNPTAPVPYVYPTPSAYAAPVQAQPVVPAAASVADQAPHDGSDNDDNIASATTTQSSTAVTDVITDEEQEHLNKLADNLKKITDAVLGVAASYAGAGLNLATLQLGEAAGEAILATAGNVKDVGQIAWWLSRASSHFDALSKPGVSKAAQIERDKLAPTLKAFKKKFSASPLKTIKSKIFGKKQDDTSSQK